MNINQIKGIEIGSRLHDEWRSHRKLENGKYDPRWKATTDNIYEPRDGKSRFNEDGVLEVDIANLSFEELPKDWQKENLEAGLSVADIVGDKQDISPEEMEEYAIKVHEAWCDRKAEEMRKYMNELDAKGLSESEIMQKVEDKYGWDKSLMVDYNLLSEEEKQKDRNHVLEATKLNKEIARGEINLEDLAKKYDKEAQSI